ncbi:hypothetical protein KSP40_PGU008563 [Platanthera guangdongensis]|uniref:Cupin type-1 domain-containing protein n=1 Tax=Platanthera guangdongensis TaxID=2320717 RepID=A0ABR2MEN8_9ASPA
MRRWRGMKMENLRDYSVWSLVFAVFIFGHLLCPAIGTSGDSPGLVATKESRRRLVHTDAGEITTVDVFNGRKDVGSYHLEFFTLDTRSLFLPVLLHTDMIFYVHTGRGNVSWIDKKRVKVVHVEEGDMYRLEEGTVFYIQSSEDPNRIKLRIHAIFNTCGDQDDTLADSFTGGAYSSIADLVRGFDNEVLQSAFGASADVIKELTRSEKVPPIIHFGIKNETESFFAMDWREGILEALAGRTTMDYVFRNKKNVEKAFSILKGKRDVENSHGWSTAVTHKEARSLKGSSMGVFMVNLTQGSMIGPHWNPRATEIAIVVKGHGMVQISIPSGASGHGDCKSSTTKRFYVKEGDVFVVPRFHPMAQLSFENSSFVFVGFSNNAKKNHPQFLAGKWSVLRTMQKEIMAASFNVKIMTLDDLLTKQKDAVLLGCDGCAEEVEKKMDAEIKREEEEKWRKEEEERREMEEARRREEEKKARKQEEEKQRKEQKREEEEQRKREEEEEARKREEEQRKKEEEEEARKREEEEKQRREEEEHRREEKEEEKQREKEEEEVERKEKEKERQKEMEEEEEIRRKEEKTRREEEAEEEEAQRRWEEEERRQREGKKQEKEQDKSETPEEETSWEEEGGKVKWRRMWMI